MKPDREGIWRNNDNGLIFLVVKQDNRLLFSLGSGCFAPFDCSIGDGEWSFLTNKETKIRKIYFWHGSNEKLFEKLSKFCYLCGKELTYVGSLDDFELQYGDKFIVLGDVLCVTQHSNFGQRG